MRLVLGAAVAFVFLGCGASSPPPASPARATAISSAEAHPEAPPPSGIPLPRSSRPRILPGTDIEYLGGNGSSEKDAVLIHGAHGERDGVDAEYKYLEMVYGPEGERWNRREQSLLDDGGGGRSYDELEIDLDGKNAVIFFDITEYYGKF